jgi:Na+/H+ antiporter NhaD/arsenite permease-like protein
VRINGENKRRKKKKKESQKKKKKEKNKIIKKRKIYQHNTLLFVPICYLFFCHENLFTKIKFSFLSVLGGKLLL